MALRRWCPGGSGGPEPGGPAHGVQGLQGFGDYDEDTGLHDWYDLPPGLRAGQDPAALTWSRVLAHWALIETDLQDTGLDLAVPGLLRARSGRWLRVRVLGLLARDSRLARALAPPAKPTNGAATRQDLFT